MVINSYVVILLGIGIGEYSIALNRALNVQHQKYFSPTTNYFLLLAFHKLTCLYLSPNKIIGYGYGVFH